MMKSNRHLPILTLLILLLAVSAFAQPGHHRRVACREDGFQGRGFGLQMLDLDDQQQQAVDKIQEKARTRALEHRKEMLRLRNELDGLMLADEPDASKAAKLIETMGSLRTAQRIERMERRLEIRKLLTPEQRDRWIAHQGRRDDRGRGRDCRGFDGDRGFKSGEGRGRGYRR